MTRGTQCFSVPNYAPNESSLIRSPFACFRNRKPGWMKFRQYVARMIIAPSITSELSVNNAETGKCGEGHAPKYTSVVMMRPCQPSNNSIVR